MPDTADAVSYTHLDVYKRQVLQWELLEQVFVSGARQATGVRLPSINSKISPTLYSSGLAVSPVSYTHLDVYKRQR